MKIEEVGFIDKGTGKHQSNVVYSARGDCSYSNSKSRSENFNNDFRFGLCNEFSYCLDANYAKGISFEQFLKKHRRQLIIEVIVNDE